MTMTEIPQMYESAEASSYRDNLSQIVALARVANCSTNSELNVDLVEDGYSGLFEVIHRLALEAIFELEEMEKRRAN